MNHLGNAEAKVLISTTQRCGSTWISSMCCKIFGKSESGEYVSGLPQRLMDVSLFGCGDAERVAEFSQTVRNAVLKTGLRVFKTHDLPLRLVPLFLDQNPDFWVFNIVRDFRDVMISRLMYNRYYLPTVGLPVECRFVEEQLHLTEVEMVRQFYGTKEMLDWLVQWKLFNEPVEHERYARLEYEVLLNEVELKRTVELLGQKLISGGLPPERVEEIAAASQFQDIEINLKRDRKQREIKTAFCRKGVAGDHERFLTKSQSDTLKILMQ